MSNRAYRIFSRLAPFIAILLVATLIVIFNGGIAVGSSNHVGLLPVVRRILNPQYLPGDFNIELRLYHHRVFALILATLSSLLGEDRAIIMLHIVSVLTLSGALYYLCRASGIATLQYLLLGFLIAVNALWIGLGLEENNFAGSSEIQPPVLAHAFVLVATAALIQRRWFLAAFFAGLVALVHLQIGLIFALLVLPFFLAQLRDFGWKKTVAIGLVYLIPAFPAIWNAVRLLQRGVSNSSFSIEYLQFRMPHHFELSSTAAGVWVMAHFLLIAGVYLFLRRQRSDFARPVAVFLTMSAVLSVLVAIHALDYNWLHFMTSLKIQFPRLSPLVTVFGALSLLCFLETMRGRGWRFASLPYIALLLFGAFATWRLLHDQPDRFEPRVQKYANQKSTWVDVCNWTRGNAPPDVVFLAPPGRYGFTYLTDRSSVVEFKINPDGGQLLKEWTERLTDFCGGTLPNGRGLENRRLIDRAFGALSADQLRDLAVKYNARFAILPQTSTAPFPTLYQNRDFRVVQVPF